MLSEAERDNRGRKPIEELLSFFKKLSFRKRRTGEHAVTKLELSHRELEAWRFFDGSARSLRDIMKKRNRLCRFMQMLELRFTIPSHALYTLALSFYDRS